ncbi:MAG: primosomal protein N' [Pseudoflavonifractor sp.]|nr:primosomal protein N' [Pseudoflavonifractor sp.]
MSRYFAEVLLPLPLYSTFTYSIPDDLVPSVKVGHRVIVPFGRKKSYTGIVTSVGTVAPQGYEVKDISLVLDPDPIVRHPQLRFWDWISEYYLCAPGEVFKAALPAGLKVESETFVEAVPDYEEGDDRLGEREIVVLSILGHEGRMTPGEIEKKTGFKNVAALIGRLIERGAVMVSEKLVERYRAKKETYIGIAPDYAGADVIHGAFEKVKGAKKQETLLLAMIEMSRITRGESREVSRAALLERSGVSTAILGELVKKDILYQYKKIIHRFKYDGPATTALPVLSGPQSVALDGIHRGFMDKNIVLLHGITSSGKTEVYMHIIDYVLRQGMQALYLVPEIALTTQLTHRLQRVFGDKVIIYHSKFSDNDRVDIWKRMLADGSPCVVIGARSSIFLPYSKLGVVIVDEEHEQSYKQFDPAPRYNARDAATVLASLHGAKTLLGSATPAVETYYKALTGRYGLVTLSERYEGVSLPEIEIVDMTTARRRYEVHGTFADRTLKLSNEALTRGEQVIFFHNRRGYAPMARCKMCGWVPKCENCDVSLTYHRHRDELVCHYCGTTYNVPPVCPACKEPGVEKIGYGTERVEDEVEHMFPDIKKLRMDLDTTRNKDGYENIIDDFSKRRAQILVGTQMVTKGLDFDGVSVVGVLNADTVINYPDFRASERAFNMLEQVSGRAGRRDTQGTVIIQTSQPAHPLLPFVKSHDYRGYYDMEIAQREEYSYPPFTRLIYIYLKHRDDDILTEIATIYTNRLFQLFGNRVFGPEEPAVGRVQSLYIRKIMLKVEVTASMKKVKEILRRLYEEMHSSPRMKGIILYYDVDPM